MNIEKLGNEIIPDNNIPDFKTQLIKNGASYYHTHQYIEIFYIISGSCQHYLNGKISTLKIGDLYFLKPGDIHNFLPSETEYIHRDIMISMSFWNNICSFLNFDLFNNSHQLEQKSHLSLENIQYVEQLLMTYPHANQNLPVDSPLLRVVLIELLKPYILNTTTALSSSTPPPWLIQLIARLTLPENLFSNRDNILKDFFFSKEHICRTFKKHMGMTITDYINEKRLHYAAIMLSSSNKSIAKICEECGFQSIPYFTKIFKNKYGVPPSTLRRI